MLSTTTNPAPAERSKWRESLVGRLRSMPLRYRLSIPFFFLAFFGTSLLASLSIRSQYELINHQEREQLRDSYKAFCSNIDTSGQWALSLASSVARNPEVAAALAHKDRLRLVELCYPSYLYMREHFRISQFNFHTVPPRMFLRLQRLYEYGDDLGYRHTIADALAQHKETFGLEIGLTGYGIRGVSSVVYDGEVVGTVEIGFAFGPIFLEQIKHLFDVEASVLMPDAKGDTFHVSASTLPESFQKGNPIYPATFREGATQMQIRTIADAPMAVLVGPIRDYSGKTVALVELSMNRSQTLSVIEHYRYVVLGIGILGMLLSVWAIYLISDYFARPIAKMVSFARKIASGEQGVTLDVRPSGELGVLAGALDEMLSSLEESRGQLQDYADNLETMVHLRTRALRESEEKYRTMVENVPLVVYRLLADGKVIFVNHFVEELVGVPMHQVLEDPGFWKKKVCEDDQPRVWPLMDRCLKEGCEFKAEYRIRTTGGKCLFVLDHALPVLDDKGKVETVDGFLINVTDRHQLQQQIIQTEELRTLSEISARLAHEIRNPLAAAGGFARRLLQNLGADDPQRERVQIIVSEVARLEKILEKTLAYLKPFEVVTEPALLNELLERILIADQEMFNERAIFIDRIFSPEEKTVYLDRSLFERGIESILRALVTYCQPGAQLQVRTYAGQNSMNMDIFVQGIQISSDDIDHFFYPFTTRLDPSLMIDLPLAKMIIHKHQGLVQLHRTDSSQLLLSISLPQ